MSKEFTAQIRRHGDRRHRIAVIDGPNMSNLGARSKKVYGGIGSLDELKAFVAGFREGSRCRRRKFFVEPPRQHP
jgi:hypothetical protein